ncbi:MAG: PadR family transcriptional regulator [Chitinivibrionales bacterium]|nr:PadR family transcriptional regulator [Chitinivibrionales bacterium]
MSLKYAILGLLSLKPQTGYELKANFDQSIRYLWNADQAQIYRTLAEITKEGLAVYHAVQQIGRPNKKVYELTKAGEDELRRWLAFPLQPREQRNPELVQIFFSGRISDEEILINFKRLREGLKTEIAALLSLESHSELFALKNNASRIHFFFVMTLHLGIRSAQLNLSWIEEAIEKVEKGQLPPE